ncbi:MAG TPA: 23S rRNA (adenine(2503)-C(2))-methyltransferase RlmN, partial [bacterium]
MPKVNLKSLTKTELTAFVESLGEKPFRAAQLWSWLYNKGAASFEAMTNLSKTFRQTLDSVSEIRSLSLERKTLSGFSDTQKFL